jgi:hyaluronan synthase
MLHLLRFFIITCALIVPIVLQHILSFYDDVYNTIHLSIYGLYMFVYLILQFTLAWRNSIIVKKMAQQGESTHVDQRTNLLVVGYRENPHYFKACLESIKTLTEHTSRINKVIVVIDGNTPDDTYMVDIFNGVFQQGAHIPLDDYNSTTIFRHATMIHQHKYVCIAQPHSCKRQAMHTGFLAGIFEMDLYPHVKVETVLCTDSDTTFDAECVENMMPLFQDTKVGAVAGNLGIFTRYDSWISFLSALRYWYAFNLERAYQSFNKYVVCISGPIGMYRMDVIRKILPKWLNQSFLGVICTFGDDRHLTNHYLALDYNVLYTPYAKAQTETPSTLTRFFRQQTRWSKSAYREFMWSTANVKHQHLMLSIDLLYQLLFPYFVIGYFLYVLYVGSINQFFMYSIILTASSFIKSLYGCIRSKSWEHILYIMYGIPYMSIVFPAKIWALFTLKNTRWGTATRQSNNVHNTWSSYMSSDTIFLAIWNLVLFGGVMFKITECIQLGTMRVYLMVFMPIAFYFCLFVSTLVYVKLKRSNLQIQSKLD